MVFVAAAEDLAERVLVERDGVGGGDLGHRGLRRLRLVRADQVLQRRGRRRAALLVLADHHPRGARHPAVEAVAPQHLAHHDVVVLGILHGLGPHRLAEGGVVGQAEHGDALEALLLEGLQELRAHQDEALDEGVAGVGQLGRLERPVEVVEDVDELEEELLAAPLELALLVPGDAIAEALVLGLHLPVGGEDLGQAVLGEAGPPLEVLRHPGLGRRLQGGLGRCFGASVVVVLRPVGVVDGILGHGRPPPGKSVDYSPRARAGPASRVTTSTTFVPVGPVTIRSPSGPR